MQFDKWFDGQSKVVRIILLVIPFVGWIMQILIRLSALLRKQSTKNVVGFVVFLVAGLILTYVDVVFIIIKNTNVLIEK